MNKKHCLWLLLSVTCFSAVADDLGAEPEPRIAPEPAMPAEPASKWLGMGLVGGHTAHRDADVSYNALELHTYYRLPWSWREDKAVKIDTRLSASVGIIHGEGEETATVSLGPHLVFYGSRDGFYVEFGTRATLFSETEVGDKDFGGSFQFGSFLNFGYPVSRHYDIGLRAQHYSNAGIYKDNNGIDLAMLELRRRF